MIDDLWYKNTVIYSLDLETFMDANGDGSGISKGVMRQPGLFARAGHRHDLACALSADAQSRQRL